ncbi:MAG TPA: tRNA pseudouridine(55) synthase TruB [Stellaceae bacterium]|nr:tRNA pseudouridine(55) synthase TruB [Stellaceae bacterium]
MARKRRGSPVHGWLVLDKPQGMSSARAVAAVRRLLDAEKAGHGGTLDPLATGVLPIALGEATKTVGFAMDGRKTYRFTLAWGEERTTDDAEGEVVARSTVRPTRAAIEAVLPRFTGALMQLPPAYSAIKVEGRRAYALARGGETPALTARPIQVFRLALVANPDPGHASFEAEVGKGTYVRALGRDLATALGTLAYVAALRRITVGRFTEAHAISLENLASLVHSPGPFEHLLPIETALDDIPALALTEAEADRMRCGQTVLPLRPADRKLVLELGNGHAVCVTCKEKLVALAEIAGGALRPVRVLNL